jgi:hypothetical protein
MKELFTKDVKNTFFLSKLKFNFQIQLIFDFLAIVIQF